MPATAEVAQADHFEAWAEQICTTFVPLRARPAEPGAFRGTVRSVDLGAVLLSDVRAGAAVVERTPQLIRRNDPELFKFALQTHGTGVVEQGGRQARLEPGDLTIYDTSRPYRIGVGADFAMTVAMFPRHLLRLPARRLAELTAVRLPADAGVAPLIAPLLRGLASAAAAGRPGTATHLGDAVVDLVGAAFAPYLGDPDAEPDARRTLAGQARAHIERQLGDPALGIRAVAAAQHVSVRSLQKVFEAEGTSVSALIRQRRLERCRRDLADPSLAGLSLAAIARRWGIPDAARFSRSFRAAYGVTPREYRASATGPP